MTKSIVERLLVHHGVEVTDEQLGADFDIPLLVRGCLVNAYAGAIESDVVHDLGRIVGLFLGMVFDEAEALMLAVDTIDGHVDITHAASVEHQLMENAGRDALMEVTAIDRGFLVLFPGGCCQYVHMLLLVWHEWILTDQ